MTVTPPASSKRSTGKVAPPLPSHVEEALQTMAAMHTAHHDQASTMENAIDRVTATISAPRFVVYVGSSIAIWIAVNYLLLRAGYRFGDAPDFPFLEIVVACIALLIAILILASQRRADKLANLREQMTFGDDPSHDPEGFQTN